MKRSATSVLLLLALAAAGCGGSSDDHDPTTSPRTATAPDAAAIMRHAVERALSENLALSRRVLWTNQVPSSARNSTRGAALVEMRRSAVDRRRQGVRVRVVQPRMRVEAIQIEPSYERATATVVLRDRVRIEQRNKRPRLEDANSRVRIELRRVGHDDPPLFVVWQVNGAR